MAEVVNGLGQLPAASEVKGPVFFELGWHLSIRQLGPGRGLETDGKKRGVGVKR